MMRAMLMALAFVVGAGSVSAQEPMSAELNDILNAARQKGLPTDPIVAKARQGVLFKKSDAKIVAAAQAVSRRLEQAREALGSGATIADLNAGQDALSVEGVTTDMLRVVRRERPSRPVVVPVGLLAQLVASGVNPSYATDLVAKLVRANASDVQLVSLGEGVNSDVHSGAKAMQSLEVRLKALRPVLAYTTPATAASAVDAFTTGTTADPRSKPPRP
jgi:hypothetical protein